MKASELGNSGTLLDEQKSDNTDERYEIRWNKDNGYSCSCQGFLASKKRPKSCKHIRRYEFKYQLDSTYSDMESRGFMTFQSEGSKANLVNRALKTAIEVWKGLI